LYVIPYSTLLLTEVLLQVVTVPVVVESSARDVRLGVDVGVVDVVVVGTVVVLFVQRWTTAHLGLDRSIGVV
jgi:hypothetical protein